MLDHWFGQIFFFTSMPLRKRCEAAIFQKDKDVPLLEYQIPIRDFKRALPGQWQKPYYYSRGIKSLFVRKDEREAFS